MKKAKSHLPQKLEAMATANEEQLRLLTLIEKNTRAQDQQVQLLELRQYALLFFRVEDFDSVKQEFTCEFFIAATWEEPSLEGKPENKVDWDEKWDPRLHFDNTVEIKSFEQKHKIFTSDEEERPPTVQFFFMLKKVSSRFSVFMISLSITKVLELLLPQDGIKKQFCSKYLKIIHHIFMKKTFQTSKNGNCKKTCCMLKILLGEKPLAQVH